MRHTSGHMCVVSSAVLAELGMTGRAVDVPGGKVVTDAGGRPTGLLQERAQELVADLVRPYPVSVLAGAIGRASGVYLSEGITSVTEAGIGGGWIGHTPVELAAYQARARHRPAAGPGRADDRQRRAAPARRARGRRPRARARHDRPGMLADLVVLSEDPTAVSPSRIAGLTVLATLTGGESRFGGL